MLQKRLGAAELGCALWLAAGSAAIAQAPGTAGLQPSGQEASHTLEEVIVTAQGRPERALDVPATLTTFTGGDLAAIQPHDLGDLALRTPGLVVATQYPTNPTIVLRGVSTDSPDPTREPRVSVYQDGVYFSRPQSALFEMFDEARVEVVKGPQTTQFGRGAIAGAIDVVTNKPDLSGFAAEGRVEGGDYAHHLEALTLNAPLGSQAAVRLALLDRHTDGYVRNLAGGAPLNGVSVDAARLSFRWRPDKALAFGLILNGQHDRYTSPSTKTGVFYPADPATGATLGDASPDHAAYLQTAPGFSLGGAGGRRTLGGATLLASYAVTDALKLRSATAYTGFRTHIVSDYDGSSLQLATSGEDLADHQISEDLRLTFEPDRRFSAYAGVGYAYEHASQAFPVSLNENEVLGLLTGVINRGDPRLRSEAFYNAPQVVGAEIQGLAGSAGLPVSSALAAALAGNLAQNHMESLTRQDSNAYYDIFAGGTLRVTERLKLEAGLRLSAADKQTTLASSVATRSVLGGVLGALQLPAPVSLALLQALAAPGAASIPYSARYPIPQIGLFDQPTATPSGDRRSHTDVGPSGQLSLIYQLRPAANLYLTYGHGRLPSVVSAEAPTTPGGPTRFVVLAPETLESIEAGAKAELLHGRLSIDAAAYQLFYQHFDTEVISGATLIQTDAGRADIPGLEVSGRAVATRWADLNLAYAYTHARFGSGLYDGNHFRLSPDHTLYARADIHFRALGGVLHVIPEDSLRSRVYFDSANGDLKLSTASLVPAIPYQASQGAVNLVNLRLLYAPARSPWGAELALSNLTDARYVEDVGAGSLNIGLPSYIAGPPRRVTFALTVQWGA